MSTERAANDAVMVVFLTGLILTGIGAGARIPPMLAVGITLIVLVCVYSVYDIGKGWYDGS